MHSDTTSVAILLPALRTGAPPAPPPRPVYRPPPAPPANDNGIRPERPPPVLRCTCCAVAVDTGW